MANVVTHPHPQKLGFHTRPVTHSPSPLGFGFGLSAAPHASPWAAAPAHSTWAASTHTNHPVPPTRTSKRRHEDDETDAPNKHARDDAMDRSPTPERPKWAAPKRARTTPAAMVTSKGTRGDKNTQGSISNENDVDVGVLLGATLFHQAVINAESACSKPPSAVIASTSKFLDHNTSIIKISDSIINSTTVTWNRHASYHRRL